MKRNKMIVFVIIAIFGFLIWLYLPPLQLNHFDLDTNNTAEAQRANLENQYRTTITQAFVGIAVLYGVYQSWQRITIAENGQITERFTRAIDQLGSPVMEIRLGGIYALERISKESKEDYFIANY